MDRQIRILILSNQLSIPQYVSPVSTRFTFVNQLEMNAHVTAVHDAQVIVHVLKFEWKCECEDIAEATVWITSGL